MLQRIRQFLAAITARVTDDNRSYVETWLTADEQKLFWQMNLPDQCHALRVAYTAASLAENRPDIDSRLLIRCALLHDVGKVKGDVSTMDKIVTVLAYAAAPDWARQWGRQGRGSCWQNVRHAFFIYFHHASISADMLADLSLHQEATIVAGHHKAPADNDPPELVILRQADDLN